VRYRGTGARKPILLLAHTDVVEAKREDWSMDPFTFIEKDGYFYGRGTGRRQGAGCGLDREPDSLQTRRDSSPTATSSSRSQADEEGGGPYNGSHMADQKQT
jgi:hypothetical protein